MKTVGLITEYNPFHNGHLYHIEKAKELTGADRVIVIMSGDYVQRGTPAVLSKHSRAHMALLNGASVVLELPVCYSCASAEFFAKGAELSERAKLIPVPDDSVGKLFRYILVFAKRFMGFAQQAVF